MSRTITTKLTLHNNLILIAESSNLFLRQRNQQVIRGTHIPLRSFYITAFCKVHAKGSKNKENRKMVFLQIRVGLSWFLALQHLLKE